MSEDNKTLKPSASQKKSTSGNRGPMAGGGIVEKPKNFKKTLGKLIRYMHSNLLAIIIAMVLAAGAVVLTITVPDILGDGIDELMVSGVKRQFYNGLIEMDENPDVPFSLSYYTKSIDDGGKGYTTFEDLYNDPQLNTIFVSMLVDENGEERLATSYKEKLFEMSILEEPKTNMEVIGDIAMLIIILVAISAVISYAQGFILASVAQKISYRFRKEIYGKMNKLPLKFYDKVSNGEVLSYLTNDVDTIANTLNQSLSQLITSIATVIGVLVMMLTISVVMTGLALLIIPFSFILMMVVVKISQKYFIRQQKYLGSVNSHIEEMYSGQEVIQLYNAQQESFDVFSEHNNNLYASAKTSQFLSGLLMPVMTFVGNIGYVVACVAGGLLVIDNKMSVGDIQAFIQYMRQFNQPLGQLANIINTLQSTVAAAERVFGFLEAEDEKESGDKVLSQTEGNVEFKNVKFGYNPDKTIINDFSSSVKAGSRVAIVGPTGAGKTTIVKLLMRFYDINAGQILVDGTDIATYSRSGLREQFGMVLQDTWLFKGSVRENIRYGNLKATDKEVEEAAHLACADSFIKTLPNGYDFEINEQADNISQGQKQLLTIARAILNDPKVLILDEATSSVDTRTEILIQKAMETLMKGRTNFIIAHRLSTIRDADKILVMKDGDIIEQGNHAELMEQKGFYETLYNSQFA